MRGYPHAPIQNRRRLPCARRRIQRLYIQYTKLILATLLLYMPSSLFDALYAAAPTSQSVIRVGYYEKLESTTSGHCHGYSIYLWKYKDTLFGLLHRHQGLCGDPPCGVLDEIKLNPANKRISFKVDMAETRYSFSGTLDKELLTGTITEQGQASPLAREEFVRLQRQKDDGLEAQFDSLEAWHRTYDPITRCQGVRTYMRDQK